MKHAPQPLPEREPDELDRLLGQVKRPEPPAWFEARLMARIRREEKQKPAWAFIWKPVALFGLAAVIALGCFVALQGPNSASQAVVAVQSPVAVPPPTNTFMPAATPLQPEDEKLVAVPLPTNTFTPTATPLQSEDEKLVAALSDFSNYTEEQELWNHASSQ